MKILGLVGIAVLATVASCALPPANGGVPEPLAVATAAAPLPLPVVQVRDYSGSAVVSVMAWDRDDPDVGLRGAVNREGVIVSGSRYGDHRLYVYPPLARHMGGFKYAADTLADLLLKADYQVDRYSCFYGARCSPSRSVGVRIPDSLLRSTRDSLVITFFPQTAEPWSVTLRQELIAAYLVKVDSVVAVMRKDAAM